MFPADTPDYYELLQISPNAEPEAIHRVYRLLAQRYHPDNSATGDEARFRVLTEAYGLLTDPERRAQYDLAYNDLRKSRWKPEAAPEHAAHPVEVEQMVRLTVLEVLSQRRRATPGKAGVFVLDLEQLTGQPREHLEFTVWYLTKKGYVQREDNSMLAISVEGLDFLESQHHLKGARKRLTAPADEPEA